MLIILLRNDLRCHRICPRVLGMHGGRFDDFYSVRRFYEFSVKLNVSKYSWFRNFQNTLAVQRVGLFLKLIRSTNISVDFLTGAGQRLGPVELRTATVFFTKKWQFHQVQTANRRLPQAR